MGEGESCGGAVMALQTTAIGSSGHSRMRASRALVGTLMFLRREA
jgi:hypothetical protein